ncbi:MAG: hypothetical protein CMD92_02795 [Gammaproteobacteria bacterium]|nr:hypothetical protein [Gammaproteobacteria bacterium]
MGKEWSSNVLSWAHRALNLEEGQAGRRLPVLRALEDKVVERVADLGLCAARRGREQSGGERVV